MSNFSLTFYNNNPVLIPEGEGFVLDGGINRILQSLGTRERPPVQLRLWMRDTCPRHAWRRRDTARRGGLGVRTGGARLGPHLGDHLLRSRGPVLNPPPPTVGIAAAVLVSWCAHPSRYVGGRDETGEFKMVCSHDGS